MDTLVTTHRFRRVVVVRCQGELDLSVKTEFALALSAIAARPADTRPAPAAEPDEQPFPVPQAVVIDLAGVTFLDCAALGVLVGLADRCVHTGHHFLLAGPQAIVRRMLAALRLDRVFVVTPTVAEAIALAESWAELDGPPSAPRAAPRSTHRRRRTAIQGTDGG